MSVIRYRNKSDEPWQEIIAIKGDKGDPGDTGRGIAAVNIVDGHLHVTYSDGVTVDLGNVKGESPDIEDIKKYINESIPSYPTKTSDLENDGDGTNKFVTFGDYATQTNHGLVKLNPFHGIQATTSGNAVIVPATEKEIDSRSGTYKPITASTIEYAVKSVGDGYYRKETSQVTEGTEIAIADNTEYRLSDVTTLTLTYPEGNFECWMLLDFADEGNITVTLPESSYIGAAPTFANGETWEISIKDGVIVSAKVGDGT